MPPVSALFPPYITKMKEGENKEETGLKQGGNLTVFRGQNGRIQSPFQTGKIVAKSGDGGSYLG
jgi:hypothetical protein